MTMLQDRLEGAGLTENEANVLLALYRTGRTNVKPLLEKTGLHRQSVYNALEQLIDKGLASYVIESGTKRFKATDPSHCLTYFNKQKQEIEEEKERFETALPSLHELHEEAQEEHEANVYRGNTGIKTLLDDMLNTGETIHTIGASESTAEAYTYQRRFNLPNFHRARRERGIDERLLLSEELEERGHELHAQPHTNVGFLPSAFTSNTSTNIYGDKVSILLWGSQPFGILIKSSDIADGQRRHFNLLWETSTTPE